MQKVKAVLFSIVLTVVLLELCSAFILYKNDIALGNKNSARHLYDPYRGHALNPEYAKKEDTEGKRIHSEDGFRESGRISKNKPEPIYRIIVMGGSTLYGLGAGGIYPRHRSLLNDETIDYFLETMINDDLRESKTGKQVEIINAAVTGYHTFQHLIYINEILHEYHPDLILFIDGHNDFYISKPGYNHWMDYGYSSVLLTESYNNRYPLFTLYTLFRGLSKYSHFCTLAEKLMERLWNRYESRPRDTATDEITDDPENLTIETYQSVADRTFLRAYHQIQELGKYDHFDMAVCLQPEIIFEDEKHLSEADRAVKKITEDQYRDKNIHGVTVRKRIRTFLPELFDGRDIAYFDAGDMADERTPHVQLYLDYCHLTPAGSKQAAAKIYKHIRDFIVDRVKRRPG